MAISASETSAAVLTRYGIRERGDLQLAPARALLAFLYSYEHDPITAIESEPVMMNGTAWLVRYLKNITDELFIFECGTARARRPGGHAIGPAIPLTAFEQHFLTCPFTTASAAICFILAWFAARGEPAPAMPYATWHEATEYLVTCRDAGR